jgi:hypothetical protein
MTVSKTPKPKPPVLTSEEKARVIDLRNEQARTLSVRGPLVPPKPKPAGRT